MSYRFILIPERGDAWFSRGRCETIDEASRVGARIARRIVDGDGFSPKVDPALRKIAIAGQSFVDVVIIDAERNAVDDVRVAAKEAGSITTTTGRNL